MPVRCGASPVFKSLRCHRREFGLDVDDVTRVDAAGAAGAVAERTAGGAHQNDKADDQKSAGGADGVVTRAGRDMSSADGKKVILGGQCGGLANEETKRVFDALCGDVANHSNDVPTAATVAKLFGKNAVVEKITPASQISLPMKRNEEETDCPDNNNNNKNKTNNINHITNNNNNKNNNKILTTQYS